MSVDQDHLVSALKLAKTKPMFFAYIAKGTEGKLLVDKKRIPPKDVAEAKKECGGGTIFTGRCLTEEGTLVFEVAKEAPSSLAGQIKKTIKNDASLTLSTFVRVNEKADHDEEHAAETPPSVSDKVSAAPPPPAPPPPSPPHSSGDGTAVVKRLNALTGGIKTALAGPNASRVQSLFTATGGLIKNKDFTQAAKFLDELEALVKSAATASGPTATAGLQAEWERRVIAMEPRVLEAKKNRPDEAKWMTLFRSVQDLGEAGDYAKAIEILNQLDTLLNPPKSAPAANHNGIVSFQQLRLVWEQARKKASHDLGKLRQAILDDFEGEPEFNDVADSVKVLDTALDAFDQALTDKLDQALNAAVPDERQKFHKEAGALISKYTTTLNADPMLKALDTNPFVPVSIFGTLSATLTLLSKKLAM